MTLFTKEGCGACDYIKKNFDLARLGVEVQGLDDAAGLAELAWHGLVESAQKQLPILVRDDDETLVGPNAVRDYLIQLSYAIKAA